MAGDCCNFNVFFGVMWTGLSHSDICVIFRLGGPYGEKLVLKMLPEAAGRVQHFQARGHSFSLYGPALSRHITHSLFFPAVIWLTSGFVYAILSLNRLTCRRSTEPLVKI